MSVAGKSMLFLLRRCLGPASAIRTRTLSVYSGFLQPPSWTSATQSTCAQSLWRTWSALRSSRHQLCTKAPHEEEYPPLPAYESDPEPAKKDIYIIQVKGLPWSCTTEDLLKFFSDCRIRDGESGIHLTLDRQGRPSGRAFIEMEHEEDVRKALEKHRQYLGPRYVEVFELTNSEAEDILRKSIQTPADTRVVRLRGLPFSSTEEDIAHFFRGLHINQKGITIVRDRRGRNSGEAFVWFSTQEDADVALQRDRDAIGNRYIEVFPSNSAEIRSGWRNAAQVKSRETKPFTPSSFRSEPLPQHYIHMRGLPFQVSGEDIVKFFHPLVLSKILIEYGGDGRPSGEADVYFSSHQEAVDGMSRDRQNIRDRYIELFLNSEVDTTTR
ncbi:G-rich sequence factor 1 [Synchiropus splendidus]|uniref:G-rich sequence factor 1 n=1 Tax=Synchiropus splendidus TaxID=270530 RepID=UPI00237D6B8D|nr:G-rich sequence factor 1 [Synchiropus splendidus]